MSRVKDYFHDEICAAGEDDEADWRESTFRPRKNPDQRVMEEVHQIDFAIDRLKSHLAEGGSFPRKGILSALILKLSEVKEHVLTPMEQEAAE